MTACLCRHRQARFQSHGRLASIFEICNYYREGSYKSHTSGADMGEEIGFLRKWHLKSAESRWSSAKGSWQERGMAHFCQKQLGGWRFSACSKMLINFDNYYSKKKQ
jgi:hypothetical protein